MTRADSSSLQLKFQQGLALHQQGKLAEAEKIYRKILTENRKHCDALHLLGVIAIQRGRMKQGIDLVSKALAINPNISAAHNNLGNALKELKRPDEALASYDKAIALQPDYADAYNNRGVALKDLKRLEEAISSYDKALALKPAFVEAHHNRGNALVDLQRFDEALASYDRAIALKPDYASAYSYRGVALKQLKRFDEALASFDKAIALKPDFADAVADRGHCLLLIGKFEQGWRDYELRKNRKELHGNRSFPKPLWLGDADISGKTILVHWEQGLGDTIQFCRYIPLLEEAGAKVLFAPQKPLRALMRGLSSKTQIVDVDDPGLNFDFHCSVMSLPLAFATTLASVPHSDRYLSVEKHIVAAWESRLGPKTKPRVGLVWSGSMIHKRDMYRSIELLRLACLIDGHCQFVSLQKEVRDHDKASLASSKMLHFGDDLADFTDTAALCELMDLVISVDTSVAHLAGALGKPVWIMLPWMPDFRWMLDRDDSPWYPSLKIYRQDLNGDWDGVVERVKADIRRMDFDEAPAASRESAYGKI